tara:strand:- start:6 stop:206 length:201 start_codon:yes stop_codon:yes gene_type:complete
MKLDWLDVLDIAIELYEAFPTTDPQWISFPDLHKKVCELENFIGDPGKSNEKILEAIQSHWIEEYQ